MLRARLAIALLGVPVGLMAALGAVAPAGASALAHKGRVYSLQLPGRSDEALLGVAVGRHGTVWVSDQADGDLIALRPDGRRRYFRLGAGALRNVYGPDDVVYTVGTVFAAPDGSVYVAEHGALARVTSKGVRTYRLPSGRFGSPDSVTSGPGRDIWFTETNRPYIGRFDPTDGRITEFRDGTDGRGVPADVITTGPDGRLWYTLPVYYGDRPGGLGAISTSGKAHVYRSHTHGLLREASGIVADRGALWVLGDRSDPAPPGEPQTALLRVVPGAHGPSFNPVGHGVGNPISPPSLAPGGVLYEAAAGQEDNDRTILSVTETGNVRRYGRDNGQVSSFGEGASPPQLAAAPDGSLWLGADGGVLEHLLPNAPAPCVVPHVTGYRAAVARTRLRRARCRASVGAVTGSSDTPAIVTRQRLRAATVLNPGSKVQLTVKRGVPYACDPTHDGNPDLTVLRISCTSARHLYHLVYRRAVTQKTNVISAEGFDCHFVKGTAIPAMGGGEVNCRGHDRRHRLRLDDMFYAPPR